jgi:O-antigen/teichoic acid export membrane protein
MADPIDEADLEPLDEVPDPEAVEASVAGPGSRRTFNTRGLSLRGFAARGMMINTAFNVALQGLGLVRGFIIAAFLTRADYGLWGVLGVSIGLLSQLKLIGIGDKYIQQDDPDQELAFQQAFTMEAIVTAGSIVPLLAVLPLVAVVYGHWAVVAPGAVLMLSLAAQPFQTPLWVYYRRMEFVNVQVMQAIDPILGFIVMLVLAIAGAGYWALVAGMVIGPWASAIVAMTRAPYKFRWRFDRATMRVYRAYSGPLLISISTSIVLANAGSLALNYKVGLAGVGIASLAASITSFATNVDDIVSGTLYPAICAAQDRVELLRESFEKANRLALMWAMPFGVGLSLFCGDLVRFGLGSRWGPAVTLLDITGVAVALGHIGFNWDDYFRARSETRPIAIASGLTAVAFVGIGVPLTIAYGLRGFGYGILIQALVAMVVRGYFVTRLFDGFAFVRHSLRAVALVVPGIAVTLALRAVAGHDRSFALAVAEVALFVVLSLITTWTIERTLLKEAVGYLLERRRRAAPA